jgi:CO/xanthine dehydrogenase FAD-binding subunit
LDELWNTIEREPNAALYAGGTDLLVNMRAGRLDPPALICLERIDEIKGVRDEGDKVWIGAGTTHSRLLEDPLLVGTFPALVKALRTLGSPPIRRMGTIGGNIVNASPAGDALPPLYILEAEVEIAAGNGARSSALRDFIVGPGQVRLARGEIVTGVRASKPSGYGVHHFEKIGLRSSQACSVASLAAMAAIDRAGVIESIRLAWGSVGPTVARASSAEEFLVGKRLSLDVLANVTPMVENAISPISDIRASADYRRSVAGGLLLRLSRYLRREGALHAH